jgi:hypothetical protein
MYERALTAADLDSTDLLALLEREDPVGVLSIFADAESDARRSEIDLRNRMSELQRRLGADGPRERAEALADTVARRWPDIEALWDPTGDGRGRALFAPLSGGEPTRVSTRQSFANRVVLDDRPFIHPLLERLERGRPAGVALLSGGVAELLEWRHGELVALARFVAEIDAPRERPGPVAAGPARHQQTTPWREQRARRSRNRRRRFLDHVASEMADAARRHGWERLVLAGAERLTRRVLRALPESLRDHAIRDRRHLIELESDAVEPIVRELLERQQADWDARLVQSVRDAAMGGRGGALGLSEVLAALNDARVEHLVYDPDVRYDGAIASDGRLVVPPEWHPTAGPLTPEPRLTERMVERCLATGARITPVSGPAAAMLADMGAVAARLRW